MIWVKSAVVGSNFFKFKLVKKLSDQWVVWIWINVYLYQFISVDFSMNEIPTTSTQFFRKYEIILDELLLAWSLDDV